MDIQQKKQRIQDALQHIPKNVRQAIAVSDWKRKAFSIGQRYKLHLDDIAFLETELGLAMVGLSDQGQFMNKVQRHVGLSENKFYDMVNDINTEIFASIRNTLKDESGDDLHDHEHETLKNAGVHVGDNPYDDYQPEQNPIVSTTPKAVEENTSQPVETKPFDQRDVEESVPLEQAHDPYRESIE